MLGNPLTSAPADDFQVEIMPIDLDAQTVSDSLPQKPESELIADRRPVPSMRRKQVFELPTWPRDVDITDDYLQESTRDVKRDRSNFY